MNRISGFHISSMPSLGERLAHKAGVAISRSPSGSGSFWQDGTRVDVAFVELNNGEEKAELGAVADRLYEQYSDGLEVPLTCRIGVFPHSDLTRIAIIGSKPNHFVLAVTDESGETVFNCNGTQLEATVNGVQATPANAQFSALRLLSTISRRVKSR